MKKKRYTKTDFVRENNRKPYKGIRTAYDLNRVGSFCGNKKGE